MQVRGTYRITLNCLPACFNQNRKTLPTPVFRVSSDKGLLSSSGMSWPCVLLLECQLEGQAKAASWMWNPYSKIVLPLSCDTQVRSKWDLLPVTQRAVFKHDLFLHHNRVGFLFVLRGSTLIFSWVLEKSIPCCSSLAWLSVSLT
jgi:hypothetical protein